MMRGWKRDFKFRDTVEGQDLKREEGEEGSYLFTTSQDRKGKLAITSHTFSPKQLDRPAETGLVISHQAINLYSSMYEVCY